MTMTTTAPLDGGRRWGTARGDRGAALRTEAYTAVLNRIIGLMGVALDVVLRTSALPEPAGERSRARAGVVQRSANELCKLHGIRVRVRGTLPEPPFVLVANHVSYIDPLVLAALTPCVAIAKHEVGAWPMIGARLRELGVQLVDRTSAHSGARALRGALRALGHGVPVLNFPEGTTTCGDTVLPFRTGIFGIAQIAGVPIVPAAIVYDPPELCWVGDDAFLPHYLRLSGRHDAGVSIALGEPILSGRRSAGSPTELAARARAAVVHLLSR
jgi:lyso-ornithine lipid O-acyltransferase